MGHSISVYGKACSDTPELLMDPWQAFRCWRCGCKLWNSASHATVPRPVNQLANVSELCYLRIVKEVVYDKIGVQFRRCLTMFFFFFFFVIFFLVCCDIFT